MFYTLSIVLVLLDLQVSDGMTFYLKAVTCFFLYYFLQESNLTLWKKTTHNLWIIQYYKKHICISFIFAGIGLQVLSWQTSCCYITCMFNGSPVRAWMKCDMFSNAMKLEMCNMCLYCVYHLHKSIEMSSISYRLISQTWIIHKWVYSWQTRMFGTEDNTFWIWLWSGNHFHSHFTRWFQCSFTSSGMD